MKRPNGYGYRLLIYLLFAIPFAAQSQTETDGIMMPAKNFCSGFVYSHSSWKEYWEGTFKRDNANLGTVSSNMYAYMGNYGINNKLNALFGLGYVQTKASAGTLKGMRGIQDLSLSLKWMPIKTKAGKGLLTVYGVGGLSFPLSNYVSDYLPLSIGLGSTNFTFRAMGDYEVGKFFATGSAAYILRSNVKIDRTSYYTTEMHYTNEVEMPDAANFILRTGYRSNSLVAELTLENWTTLGGFDIRKNDMPFLSNEMNATKAGAGVKYTVYKIPGLSLIGGGNYTFKGRNVGQSTAYYAGAFIVFGFAGKNNINNQK